MRAIAKPVLCTALGVMLLGNSFSANAGSSPPPCTPYPACWYANNINPLLTSPVELLALVILQAQIRAWAQVALMLNMPFAAYVGSGRSGLDTEISPVAGGSMFRSRGMAAGDDFAFPYSFWGSVSRTDSEDDFVSTAFDSTRYNFLAGADFSPREGLVMGLALGYEDQDVDTTFNAGNADMDGFTVVPYLSLMVGDKTSVNLSFGYSDIDISQFRSTGGVPGGAPITSKVDSERWFFSGNAAHYWQYGNWNLTGHAGVFWAKDQQDAFTESDATANLKNSFKLGQWRIGIEGAYPMGAFEPYASATLENDFSRTQIPFAAGVARAQYDPTDVLLGFGLRYFADDGLSGSIGYSTVVGRNDYDEDTFQLMVRAEF